MRFYEQARELFDSEFYEMAVVAAQVHFELHLSYLLEQARSKDPRRWVQNLLKHREATNLTRDQGQAVIELLLGIKANQLEGWAQFVEHLKRRNAVVHAGAEVSRQEADASLEAVHDLWLALNRAAQGMR